MGILLLQLLTFHFEVVLKAHAGGTEETKPLPIPGGAAVSA